MHKPMSPHGDYNHMGEAINLVNNFKVEKVIFNCGPYNDLENENYRNNWILSIVSEEEMRQSLPEFLECACEDMYSSDGVTYFISEDLLNKHLRYIESLEIPKL